MLQIKKSDIRLGHPLPWDCYDQSGTLLLRKGSLVSSERQIEGLIERGLFVNNREGGGSDQQSAKPVETAQSRHTPFHFVDDFKRRLKAILEAIVARQGGDIQARIIKLSQDIQALCELDADAALASLHLDHDGRYTILHPLHVAILCELIGKRKEVTKEERVIMLSAALLSNVAMIDLQESLQKQQTPLTEEQKEQIRLHPVMAVDLMLDAGIQDDLLFNAVLHHHEKYDGSGYPGTLRGDDIPLIVRIIALADTYSAMIAPRVYRGHILARDALREIFLKRGSAIDADLAQLIIKELGVFPPGAFVKLHNGETALVIKRGANATNPLVQSVVGPRGAPLPTPIKRDCNDSRYVIQEMVVRDRVAVLDLHKLWGYH